MPNVKVLVEGKWITYIFGVDGVKNIFVSDNGNVIVLGEHGITELSGFPFVLEREYSKKDAK